MRLEHQRRLGHDLAAGHHPPHPLQLKPAEPGIKRLPDQGLRFEPQDALGCAGGHHHRQAAGIKRDQSAVGLNAARDLDRLAITIRQIDFTEPQGRDRHMIP